MDCKQCAMCMQIKRAGAAAIARAVSHSKTTFKSLALDENEISDAGIVSVKVALFCPSHSLLPDCFA